MIDAKLKGEGIEDEEVEEPDHSNVVDLMAALRKSLAPAGDEAAKQSRAVKAKPSAKADKKPAATRPPKATRKRA